MGGRRLRLRVGSGDDLIPYAWPTAPYRVFWMVSVAAGRSTAVPRASAHSCVVAAFMLAFTFFFYVGSLDSEAFTFALLYLFVPQCLFVGGPALLVAGLLALRLVGAYKKMHSS